jgi:cellulose synthase/poly-beta-1,6-N-acetylglucosamine synthase-like glycosyltransferase
VVAAPRGRARQLNAAAATAEGDLLLFLHADSLLPLDAYASLTAAWRDPAVAGGNFALRFEGNDLFARTLTTTYAAQRRLGYFYGDSSIFARREAFEALGGFRELAVMDDYDFARRLARHGRLTCLPGPATTSSRRWRRLGVLRTVLSWVVIRWLFVLRVPPERLAKLYRRAR